MARAEAERLLMKRRKMKAVYSLGPNQTLKSLKKFIIFFSFFVIII
jgi:hypothetical protein